MSRIFHRPPRMKASPTGPEPSARVPLWVLLEVAVAFFTLRRRIARRRNFDAAASQNSK